MTSTVIIVFAVLLLVIGLFCLVKARNIIRVIIATEIMMKSVTLVLALAGLVTGNFYVVETFIVIMIVIEVVLAVVSAGIAVSGYKHNDSLDIDKLTKTDD